MRVIVSAIIISAGLICGGSFAGGRYGMVAVNGGVIARIDRATGEVQSCQLKDGQKCIWQSDNRADPIAKKLGLDYPIVLPIPSSSPAPR